MMNVLIERRGGKNEVDEAMISELANFAMHELSLPENTEVSITFVDNDEMADLNFEYRGIEGPTDVLSFECDNLEDDFPELADLAMAEDNESEHGFYSLGDVIIAPDVAFDQASAYGNTFEDELALLLVHGILHLRGYDHIDDEDAHVMEAKEREILTAWKDPRKQ